MVTAVLYGVLTRCSPVVSSGLAINALALTGGMALIVATSFRFVARRQIPGPRTTKVLNQRHAGELGFFSPHSWWPIMVVVRLGGSGRHALWLPA